MLDYIFVVGTYVAIDLILAVGMTVVTGLGGMFAISVGASYGVGAYITAQLALHAGLGTLGDLFVAMVGSAIFGVCLLPLIARLRSDHLAIGSLAVQLIASDIFLGWNGGTGGSYGIFGVKATKVLGLSVSGTGSLFFFCALLAVLSTAVVRVFERSSNGILLRAQRDDEDLALSWGHKPIIVRSYSFVLASALAGVAGGLFAFFQGYISPSSFSVDISLMILTIIVIGGLGNIWGSVVATAVLVAIPEALSLISATSDWVAQVQLMLDGLAVIVMVSIRSEGLIPEAHRFKMKKVSAFAPKPESGRIDDVPSDSNNQFFTMMAAVAPLSEETLSKSRVLKVEDLVKEFGGNHAVDGVSFELMPGEVTALIGPNGAGKSTALALIAGALTPNQGSIHYGGKNITGWHANLVARERIFRTFQGGRLFSSLNVLENVVVALLGVRAGDNFKGIEAAAEELLIEFELDHLANSKAVDLAYAEQKLVMIAIAAGRGDEVLLFDEVAAGLDAVTVKAFAPLVKKLASTGRTVCVVEHNLSFVWDCADRVIVMDAGRVIVDDSPSVVRDDPAVAEIYFGGGVRSGLSS
jgi:ABC-type branched-subunit amino acid transport system ATPase component/ABC-type branched-subunit amino acid transport system permease subunit